jgi:hypothetical protein
MHVHTHTTEVALLIMTPDDGGQDSFQNSSCFILTWLITQEDLVLSGCHESFKS